MVRIIIQKPDKTVVSNPEEIEIKRNAKSEEFYRMVKEAEVLSEKKEPEHISTNTIIVQKTHRSSADREKMQNREEAEPCQKEEGLDE